MAPTFTKVPPPMQIGDMNSTSSLEIFPGYAALVLSAFQRVTEAHRSLQTQVPSTALSMLRGKWGPLVRTPFF